MGLFFEVAVLLFLIALVFELRAVRIELSRLPGLLHRAEEKKDSPTINVNVGTLPAQATKEGQAGEGPAGETAVIGDEPEAPEPQPEEVAAPPAEPVHYAMPVSATPSGLVAVKCPSCQAENSSYRSECFNCGASLR